MISLQVKNFVIKTYYLNKHLHRSDSSLIAFTISHQLSISANSVRRIVTAFESPAERVQQTRSINERLRNRIVSLVEENPELSLRQIAREVSVSHETVRKVQRANGYKPYKPIEVQKLTATKKKRRLEFCP